MTVRSGAVNGVLGKMGDLSPSKQWCRYETTTIQTGGCPNVILAIEITKLTDN
jgi:hypothetical protein